MIPENEEKPVVIDAEYWGEKDHKHDEKIDRSRKIR